MRIAPSCYLTATGVHTKVGFATKGLDWFSNIDGLVASNGQGVTLDWGKHGTIVLDPTSGLLISQVITLEKGTREMKRVDWQKNPGAEMISTPMTINLDGAQKQDFAEIGTGRKILGAFFQDFIQGIGQDPKRGENLEEYLAEKEETIIEFLTHENLRGAPFFKDEILFNAIHGIALNFQKKSTLDGKSIPLKRMFQHQGFQRSLEKKVAEGFLINAAGLHREKMVRDALAGPLLAEGEAQEMARTQIENCLEKIYYRAKIRKAIETFSKHGLDQ